MKKRQCQLQRGRAGAGAGAVLQRRGADARAGGTAAL